MTRKADATRAAAGFGFAAQMRQADFTAFTRWYEGRCLFGRPSRADCEATLSAPTEPEFEPRDAAPMRDAA